MINRFPLVELPKPSENLDMVEQAIRLFSLEKFGTNHTSVSESELIGMQASTAVMAVDDGTVVAAGRFKVTDPSQPEIGDLLDIAVTSKLRRLGLGRDVLSVLEQKAKKRGITRMTVYSLDTAQGFYRRLGYQCLGDCEFEKTL